MKRALQIMIALAIVSMFMFQPVAAATSQGLEWGVAAGDRFDFTMSSTEDSLNEAMYMNITVMPALAIPDPLNNWNSIPIPSIGMWWANGTTIGLYALLFFGLIAVGSRIVVPIGNFTHLQALITPVLTGENIINTANTWGVSWGEEVNATHEYLITGTFAKADGFLAEYKIETLLSSTSAVLESISVIRNNIPSGGVDLNFILDWIQNNLIIVGAGVVILILLIIVCKKK
ncbi:MAG: hypothetical protein ACFFED_13980 [Candidatus Thorarchaeota archaeon]